MDRGIISEITSGEVNLSSFTVHDKLNPQVWNGFRMKNKIRNKLLKIADNFVESLDIPWVTIKDIVLTGSLANFNWSKYSDFDLHIILDFKEVDDNEEIVYKFFNSEKNLWNNTHDIEIYCFEVEVYVQNSKESHTSSGVFSLEDNDWVTKPNPVNPIIDKMLVREKATQILNQIEYAIDLFNSGEYENVIKYYEILNTKIRDMRKSGLDRGGEFSYENITFKVLRRTGYLQKLREISDKSYDLINSISTQCDN